MALKPILCARRLRRVFSTSIIDHDDNRRRADKRAPAVVAVDVGPVGELPAGAALPWQASGVPVGRHGGLEGILSTEETTGAVVGDGVGAVATVTGDGCLVGFALT